MAEQMIERTILSSTDYWHLLVQQCEQIKRDAREYDGQKISTLDAWKQAKEVVAEFYTREEM